jgi:acyl-CoA dehydrogenase
VTDQFGLSYAYAQARTLRLADGPDEVHRNAIGKMELGRYVSKDVMKAFSKTGTR